MSDDLTIEDFRIAGDEMFGRIDSFRYVQSPPWQQGNPMRHCRPRKPKNRALKRAKTKAQRLARRKNRR